MLVFYTIFTSFLSSTVYSIICTSCEFKLLPPHSSNCNETCEGDVCFIVVNKYFNGTINAGCMYLHQGDKFDGDAVCQRMPYDNRCACNSADRCNDPKAKLSSYTFTDEPVLVDYQWLPQIQPPQPTFQPIDPPTDLLNSQNGSETSPETTKIMKNSSTVVLQDEQNELTVTTRVGLNVGDEKSETIPLITTTPKTTTSTTTTTTTIIATTSTSKLKTIGSVEVTKPTENASAAFPTSPSSSTSSHLKNLTTVTRDSIVRDSANQIVSPALFLLFVLLLAF